MSWPPSRGRLSAAVVNPDTGQDEPERKEDEGTERDEVVRHRVLLRLAMVRGGRHDEGPATATSPRAARWMRCRRMGRPSESTGRHGEHAKRRAAGLLHVPYAG